MSPASAAVPAPRVVRTGPRGLGNPVSEFSALLHTIRDAGLLRRRRGFYIAMFATLVTLTAGAFVGFAMLHNSWFILIIAGVLGILFTQFAFLAHEAGHRQVFESGKANEFSARILADFFVGISYSWWTNKHTRHHGNPNTDGKDPDIAPDFVVFQEKDAAAAKGIYAKLIRRQGWLFYPAMLLEGLNLHQHAYRTLFSKGKVDKRALSIVLIMVRNVAYLSVVFYFLPLGMGFAFLGVQLAIFGLYMGSSFAPNHVGMPILPAESRVDFLRRQVLTSRNVSGGGFMNIFMGGLNFQVEHHLFPSMPRPHLRKASEIVREYCAVRDIPYTETNLAQAHAIVIAHMHTVGLAAAGKGFDCPTAMRYGG
ncbi:acyl-CoA desaturase [soil metagenome]